MKSKLSKAEKKRRKKIDRLKQSHHRQIEFYDERIKGLFNAIRNLQEKLNDRHRSFLDYGDQLLSLRSELIREGTLLKMEVNAKTKDQMLDLHDGKRKWREIIRGFMLAETKHFHPDLISAMTKQEALKLIRLESREIAERLTESFIIQTLQLIPEVGNQ